MFPNVFQTLTTSTIDMAGEYLTDVLPFVGLVAGIAAVGLVLAQLRRFIG